jgi:hypothetical protein
MIDDLPEGWAVTSVGQVSAAIQYGYTASAVQESEGTRFLRITDIQDGIVNWNAVPSCEIDDNLISRYALTKGDIVFARTGATTGKSFLIGMCPLAVFASYLIRLRPRREVEPGFLAYFFQTPGYWRLISENISGNAQPNCNASKLAALNLPLPPLAEQQRIVAKVEALLARLNAARQRLAKVPAILKRFRQSVLAAACSGRLTADWREEELGDGAGIEPRETEDLGSTDLPGTWTYEKLGGGIQSTTRSVSGAPKKRSALLRREIPVRSDRRSSSGRWRNPSLFPNSKRRWPERQPDVSERNRLDRYCWRDHREHGSSDF